MEADPATDTYVRNSIHGPLSRFWWNATPPDSGGSALSGGEARLAVHQAALGEPHGRRRRNGATSRGVCPWA